MASFDNEAEPLPVTNYYFEDDKNEPILFHVYKLESNVPTKQRWCLRPWSWNVPWNQMRTHRTFNCHGDANIWKLRSSIV
ncbi:hypothetical protein ABKV19_022600 [Rosa sericea]